MARKPMHTQLDHSPDPEPRDADAPRRMATGTGRTLLDAMRQAAGEGPRADDRVNDPRELMRRVAAAVACEVPRGAHGDSTQRAECEGALLLALVGEAKAETGGASTAPRTERARMVRLRWAARDWMRAERRRRDELAADLPDLATADLAGRPGEPMGAPEWSPGRAHAGALQLCALLGVRAGGNIETALYAYLRGGDADTADIATETGLTPGAARNAISNGRALIRAAYPNPADLLAALLLTDRREAGAPASASKRTRAALKQYRRDSWRDTPDAYPCEVSTRQGRPDGDAGTRAQHAAHAADATARTWRETHLAALLNPAPDA